MTNKRLKKHFKAIVLILGIIFLINNCAEDELQPRHFSHHTISHQHRSISTQKLSFNDFPHKTTVRSYIQRINNNTVSNTITVEANSDSSGSSINPLAGLNIILSQAEYTVYDGGHTYTFTTYRDIDNGLIENIVLESQSDGSYKEYLVRYQLSDTEYQELQIGHMHGYNLADRTLILQLQQGSFNAVVSNSDWCFMPEVTIQGCDGCGGPGPCHNGSNQEDWNNCTLLGQPGGPVAYITLQWQPCGESGGGGTTPPGTGTDPRRIV